VQGPGVVQLQKIRNVSAPKDNEESQGAPRIMKLSLTDGVTTCNAVELENINGIGYWNYCFNVFCLKTFLLLYIFILMKKNTFGCFDSRTIDILPLFLLNLKFRTKNKFPVFGKKSFKPLG